MTTTKYPNGVESFGIPVLGPGTLPLSGHVFFVSSVATDGGANGNDGSYSSPLLTLAQAITNCVANRGDVIYLMPGFTLTIAAAGGVDVNKAGVTIIGLGNDADRPEFTFSATASTFLITAANVTIKNIIGLPSVDSVVSGFVISAAGCTLGTPDAPVIWRDASSTVEAVRAVLTTAAADDLTINLRYEGFTAGNAVVNAVRLVGCDNARVNVDFYGVVTTAVVEFVTTACTNVVVTGYMYVSGITNFTRSVVDTITGSTWFASFYDGAAAASVSGGSGAALASDDASTIAANQTVPGADSTANVLERDVVGNKTDAAATGAVSTTESLMAYAKQNATNTEKIGTITNTGGTASVGAILGDFANTTLIGKLDVPAADATGNVDVGDVVGNKTDASIYVPGTTNSLAAYAKGIANLQERVVLKAAAVMVDNDVLFTIAGGPIKIEALWSECVTANDATASTVTYKCTPTVGTEQTISGASASIASAAAGASIALAGTALATAALYNANGPNLIANPGTIVAPIGTIAIDVAIGSTTGTWRHYLRYKPLAVGVTVT